MPLILNKTLLRKASFFTKRDCLRPFLQCVHIYDLNGDRFYCASDGIAVAEFGERVQGDPLPFSPDRFLLKNFPRPRHTEQESYVEINSPSNLQDVLQRQGCVMKDVPLVLGKNMPALLFREHGCIPKIEKLLLAADKIDENFKKQDSAEWLTYLHPKYRDIIQNEKKLNLSLNDFLYRNVSLDINRSKYCNMSLYYQAEKTRIYCILDCNKQYEK